MKVSLFSPKVRDDEIAVLKDLPNLRELSLSGTKLTDTAMEQVAGLSSLRVLSLNGCRSPTRAWPVWPA